MQEFFKEPKGLVLLPQWVGKDVFIHVSGLIDEIAKNDKVSYDIEDSPKGPSAFNVWVA